MDSVVNEAGGLKVVGVDVAELETSEVIAVLLPDIVRADVNDD